MSEQDPISRLVGLIYDAAADPECWPAVVESVLDAVGATSGGLHLYDVTTAFHACVIPRTDPSWTRCFREHWMTCEDLLQRISRVPARQMWSYETLVPRDELERSAFYNEFLRPQGEEVALGVNLLNEGTACGTFNVFRARHRGPFTKRETRVASALTPHLQRAVQLHMRLRQLETGQAGSAAALDCLDRGALLVAADGRVLFANRLADAILAKADGLRLEHGRVAARRSAETAALRRLIAFGAGSADGSPLPLPRGAGRLPLTALVLPLPLPAKVSWIMPERATAIIFLNDPEQAAPRPTTRQLESLFGLTPAQASLALEVAYAEGGLRAAAERLGIAYATARAHLAAVFGKTGVRSQAELVRLLLGCGVGVHVD